MNLTIAAINAAKPGDVLRDATVPGLQLRVFEGRRSFYCYYRTRTGTQRKPKVGDFPTITIEQARKIAKGWIADAHQGGDPSKIRKDYIASPDMHALRDRYEEKHADKKKTGDADKRNFRLHIIPKLGKLKVADVTPNDLEDFMEYMEDKGVPIAANRCMALLSKAFNLAIKWGWRTDNPTAHVERFPENKRVRYATEAEYKAINTALIRQENESPGGVAAIRLLMLTGARLSEIVRARREWYADAKLSLPDNKTGGAKEIHLSPEACAIIEATTPTDGWLVGISSRPTKVWNKARDDSGVKDLTLHDLRHSFASEGISGGLTLAQIGELLGHKSAQTTKRYAHLMDEAKREAATAIANKVALRMKI